MKEDMTPAALAAELKRQAEASADYVAPTTALQLRSHIIEDDSRRPVSTMIVGDEGEFNVGDIAHRQVAARLGIPVKFYERLRTEQPDMIDFNVNELFRRQPDTRLVRVLDDAVRAFLSNNYGLQFSNIGVAQHLLPIASELGGLIRSASITDRKLYIKVVTPKLRAQVVGDIVQAGVVIYNSEVGFGRFGFDLFTEVLSCTNGAIMPKTGLAKAHIGGALGDGQTTVKYLRAATLEAKDTAFWLEAADVMRGMLAEANFMTLVDKMQAAADTPIVDKALGTANGEQRVAQKVERITKKAGLNEEEGKSVLDFLIQGGDLSLWGLSNAVTRTAEDAASYDRASDLELLGGQIITLPPDKWSIASDEEQLAVAA